MPLYGFLVGTFSTLVGIRRLPDNDLPSFVITMYPPITSTAREKRRDTKPSTIDVTGRTGLGELSVTVGKNE